MYPSRKDQWIWAKVAAVGASPKDKVQGLLPALPRFSLSSTQTCPQIPAKTRISHHSSSRGRSWILIWVWRLTIGRGTRHYLQPPSPHSLRPIGRRRNRTTQSCLNCHTSKRKVCSEALILYESDLMSSVSQCDRKRPCQRCIQLGLASVIIESCRNVILILVSYHRLVFVCTRSMIQLSGKTFMSSLTVLLTNVAIH